MNSQLLGNVPASRQRFGRLVLHSLLGTAAVAALSCAGLSAQAAPGDTSSDTVVANVAVNSTISLNVTQSSFTISGVPNATATSTGAVTGVVTTNNATGFSVGVQAAAAALQPATSGNTDTIPIANLEVTNAAGAWTPVSDTAPVTVHTQATRSDLAGTAFSDDYRVAIPDVNSDTYSVTLDYVATAL